MSDFDPGPDWTETNSVSDAELIEYGTDRSTILRKWVRKPRPVLPTKPGTIVRIVWSAFDHYTYRVTNKGNFREIKSGAKIKKENYPHIQEVHVLYVPEGECND